MVDRIKNMAGTILNYFNIGNIRLKNNSGILEARNDADSDYIIVRGDNPAGDNDFVTRAYLEGAGGIPSSVVRSTTISFDHTGGETTSNIPSGAIISLIIINIDTAFDDGTLKIGTTADDDVLIDTGEVDITIEDEYTKISRISWGASTETLKATIAGATSGSGTALVYYSVPNNQEGENINENN